MDPESEARAASAIDVADRTAARLERLPASSSPGSAAEALAVQERVVALSAEQVGGWKVARMDDVVTWGAIYTRDIHDSPARIPAQRYPLRGVEAEIGLRLKTDIPRGGEEITVERLPDLLEPVPVFEIVNSRFLDYRGTPALDRLADRMSNGGLVVGRWLAAPPRDLACLFVRLTRDSETVFDGTGGHARGDPLIPALEFLAARRMDCDFRAGQIIATGTLSGLVFGEPGETYRADFGSIGQVEVSFAD